MLSKFSFKSGDVVRIRSALGFSNGVIKSIGRKYIYVSTMGLTTETDRFDKEGGWFVDMTGQMTDKKVLLM